MEAQANTTREQSNKKNIYDVGWQPSHGENGGVGKKKVFKIPYSKFNNITKHNKIYSSVYYEISGTLNGSP